jgi:hypothetical protein
MCTFISDCSISRRWSNNKPTDAHYGLAAALCCLSASKLKFKRVHLQFCSYIAACAATFLWKQSYISYQAHCTSLVLQACLQCNSLAPGSGLIFRSCFQRPAIVLNTHSHRACKRQCPEAALSESRCSSVVLAITRISHACCL